MLIFITLLSLSVLPCFADTSVRVDDAFVSSESDGGAWTIGTDAVEVQYVFRDGHFQLREFRNKLTSPVTSYKSNSTPFGVTPLPSVGPWQFETLWQQPLEAGQSIDIASAALKIPVHTGDQLGFAAGTALDDVGVAIDWATTVDYGDGGRYVSADETELPQGPVWYYYTHAPGTGYLDELGEILKPDTPAKSMARVPNEYRAPFECSNLGATRFTLLNAYELIRVWKAPKDGTVTVHGQAHHTGLYGPAHLSLYRIKERTGQSAALQNNEPWTLESASAQQVNVGGRPAVQLDVCLKQDTLRAMLHVQAYPKTSILRQWAELENTGVAPCELGQPSPLTLNLGEANPATLTQYWMHGGTCRQNAGQLESTGLSEPYHHALLGEKTDNFVPWMALKRRDAPSDGLLVALDYLGTWTLAVDAVQGQTLITATLPSLANFSLAAGARIQLPLVTLGVFQNDLDDMSRRLYDWQYTYLWDYTNPDYYARTKWVTAWFYCSRNLQEQYAARLANFDMDADLMRSLGMEMLWDDAGWSKFAGWPVPDSYFTVGAPTYDGPDYAESIRYLNKMGMQQLFWFSGRPSAGIMDSKVGAWGNFQWRTDGFGKFNYFNDRAIRTQIEHFLDTNPRCSFHTCDGGSRYAHQFEIQRYADVNYLSDLGRGDQTNHYFSYLEVPDKWSDILEPMIRPGNRFMPETATGLLSLVPGWYEHADQESWEDLRRLCEIYRYLRQEGVAGRWSYMMHPVIEGDTDYYYDQRTSYDRTKACIILKHRAEGTVTVFPRGLLPEHNYVVGFEHAKDVTTLTGAGLMAKGIQITNQEPSELIFLGLPNRPGSGLDTTPPEQPGQVFTRSEVNIGHSGVGIYWSCGADTNWISYHEVRRNRVVIGKASIGTFYFDHSQGWDPAAEYAVRSVDGDGNASEWTTARSLPGGELTYSALGGHFAEAGREGWSAETTIDGVNFQAMAWVPPAKNPAADFGGTPNQPGGVEGYWEGPSGARIGRGWLQASTEVACVHTWKAPRAGTVRVIGRAMKEDYRQAMGSPLRVHILHNTRKVWPEQDWAEVPLNNLVGAAHDVQIAAASGDTLRFVLDRGLSPDTDIIAWIPRICYDVAAATSACSVIRIRCGTEDPFTDSTGNVWSPDKFIQGGEVVSTGMPIINTQPAASDQPIYQHGRSGNDFTYAIPVEPGLYTVRLKLAETQYEWAFERPFNMSINGSRVLANFDVCHAAGGPHRAYDRVFKNLPPNRDGKLVLHFTGGFDPLQRTDQAFLHAIEVLPALHPIVRIDAGSAAPFIDWHGQVWNADAHFDGGAGIRSDKAATQASPTLYDQALYQTARSSKILAYAIPLTPGVYTIHLKFAELWLNETGQRPMNIEINGRRVRENWDPASAAGQTGMAVDLRFEDISPGGDGKVSIRLQATGSNDAILQGIEIE